MNDIISPLWVNVKEYQTQQGLSSGALYSLYSRDKKLGKNLKRFKMINGALHIDINNYLYKEGKSRPETKTKALYAYYELLEHYQPIEIAKALNKDHGGRVMSWRQWLFTERFGTYAKVLQFMETYENMKRGLDGTIYS